MKADYYAYIMSGNHRLEVVLTSKTEIGAKREARRVFMDCLISPYRYIHLCEVSETHDKHVAYLTSLTGKWRKMGKEKVVS